MKKLIQIMVCATLLLGISGCSSNADYNKPEEILNELMKNEKFKSHITETKTFTKEDDPNGIMGDEHKYIAKTSWADERVPANDDFFYTGGSIEIFNNSEDAKLRKEYIELYNSLIEDTFTEEEYGSFAEEMYQNNLYVHQKGNAIISFNKAIDEEKVSTYFKLFDKVIGDFKYEQKKLPSSKEIKKIKEENQKLYDSSKEVSKKLFDDALNKEGDKIDSSLAELEKSLNEISLSNLESSLDKYNIPFFANRYSGWKAKVDTIKATIEANKKAEEEKKAAEEEAARKRAAASLAQKNAIRKAESYLSIMSFSYKGLVDQLMYEGFSAEEAAYGADNCGADWNEQAAKKAKNYIEIMSFSRQSLINQLLYEGFTQAQAEYGVSAIGY